MINSTVIMHVRFCICMKIKTTKKLQKKRRVFIACLKQNSKKQKQLTSKTLSTLSIFVFLSSGLLTQSMPLQQSIPLVAIFTFRRDYGRKNSHTQNTTTSS